MLILFILPFVLFAVPTLAGADGSYVVLSDSMNPTLEAGDVVFVEETPPEAVEEGDVLTFWTEDPEAYHGDDPETNLVTHRVVEIDRSGDQTVFTTHGDALAQPDSDPVLGEQIVGTVTFAIPYLGYVIAFAGSRTGILLLVVVPCTLLVINEVYELAVAVRANKE
ncbi:signal peptidase I [Halobacteria archaeon AArc-curdl1]|uniref:Signal peptidase I n=1 Tax=Natronosalvus hydrolyticus TaxID=2979988 RepID=A0AAP2ZC74_9EURY|nr:signal peptidase I [Halobacteria archaeon AArc-curdl1]